MARINSEAVGRGSGSVGNVTYRYTRGKTIMSRRITSNRSNTASQVKQRKGFGAIAHVAKALHSLLSIGFSRHKSGYANNLFMHYNKPLMDYIRNNPGFDAELPGITNLCIALSDPGFGNKIRVANGEVSLTVTYQWGPGATIEGMIRASRKFMSGDVITLGLCYSYLLEGAYFEMIETYSTELTEGDVASLAFKSHFPITQQTFPEMDVFGILPPGFGDVEILATAILMGNKDSSTSYLLPMPDMTPEFHVAAQTFDDDMHMRLVMQHPAAFAAEMGEWVIDLPFVFLEDMEDSEPTVYSVSALSKDAGGKVNGLILSPPEGTSYIVSDYTPGSEEYSAILRNNKYAVIFTGVGHPSQIA
ncbi:MAG: hypothetical protein LBS04_07190 [Tannerellaceae bacterium]|jgi:hypothetical protein|nr:hypothetical protein [Tannerellaceae bacterium]